MGNTDQITVFRVEHRDTGVGPYQVQSDLSEEISEAHTRRRNTHPTPYGDPLLERINFLEVCGFLTREQLDRWFYGFRAKLAAAGYVIAIYSVPRSQVRAGVTQCLFERGELMPYKIVPMLR